MSAKKKDRSGPLKLRPTAYQGWQESEVLHLPTLPASGRRRLGGALPLDDVTDSTEPASIQAQRPPAPTKVFDEEYLRIATDESVAEGVADHIVCVDAMNPKQETRMRCFPPMVRILWDTEGKRECPARADAYIAIDSGLNGLIPFFKKFCEILLHGFKYCAILYPVATT